MAYEINKGAGRPVQMLGVLGMPNIWRLVIVTVVGLFSAVILIFITDIIDSKFIYGTWIVSIFIYHNMLVRKCRKYGEHGSVKDAGRKKSPELITIHSSKVFKDLRKLKR